MQAAAAAMEFERAAALRDRIRALTQVQQVQGINPKGVAEADVVALHMEGGQACVQVFFIRANQSWGNRDFYPRTGSGAEEAEVMQAFLAQFYDDKDPPRLILLSHGVEDPDLLGELLSDRAGRRVEIAVPQRGEKAELVENAVRNARESLARKHERERDPGAAAGRAGRGVRAGRAAGSGSKSMTTATSRGRTPWAAWSWRGRRGSSRSQYRKFNIQLGRGREQRRLRHDARGADAAVRAAAEGGPGPAVGRLAGPAADRRRRGAGVGGGRDSGGLGIEDVPFIGVAKGIDRDQGKEEFHRLGKPVMALQRNDPVLYFIQRLRDEAHRWAIGAHRAKRSKAIGATPLDEVPGVGAARKRALWRISGRRRRWRGRGSRT